MLTHIKKTEDGHVFSCNGIEFPVYAPGSKTADGTERNLVQALVDSVNSGLDHSVMAWQTILLANGLPVEPWIDETAKPVVMGIIQNNWYTEFNGGPSEKVAAAQSQRVREYPEKIKAIAERRENAAKKAEATKAKKSGKSDEEIAAEKAKKLEAKTLLDKARADKKAARELEKAALAMTGKTRAPRAPRPAGTGVGRSSYVYQFIALPTGDKVKPIWNLIAGVLQDNATETPVDINVVCDGVLKLDSSFTRKNVSDNIWAMHKLGGLVNKTARAQTAEVPAAIAEVAVPMEKNPLVVPVQTTLNPPKKHDTKKNDKHAKKGKK